MAATKKPSPSKTSPSKTPPKDRLQDAALALAAKDVLPLRFDPLDAKRALQQALKALAKHDRRLKKDFPGFDLAFLALGPEACDRVRAYQRKVTTAPRAAGSLEAILAAVSYRKTLLPFAQSLANAGKLSRAELDAIARGRGQTDQVQDVADLVRLLEPLKATVEGALGKDLLAKAAAAAAFALGAQGTLANADEESADLRDRYATVVAQIHERLRAAAAAVVSFNDAGFLVPALTRPGAGPAPASDADETPSAPA